MDSFVTMQVNAGSRVYEVADNAVERASQTLQPVTFRFNDVLAIAMPGDRVHDVLEDWAVDFVARGGGLSMFQKRQVEFVAKVAKIVVFAFLVGAVTGLVADVMS